MGQAAGRLQPPRQCRQDVAGSLPIKGAVPLGAKYLGEKRRLQAAQHHIGVGERGRTAAAVSGRSWIGAGGGRPHPQALAIEMDQRAAAGGHRMDGDHGRQQGKAGQLGPLAPLGDEHLARAAGGDVKDIGGGAAHVKAHQGLVAQTGGGRRTQGPHQPPSGPGKNRVLSQQLGGINQTAVGLHHPQGTGCPEIGAHLGQVGPQRRTYECFDQGGVAAGHKTGAGAHLMGKHHLLETKALQPLPQTQFVQRLAGGMQQHHGATAAAGLAGGPHRGGQSVIKAQGFDFQAIGSQTPDHLQHLSVERGGPDRLQGKEVRTVLIADQQGIGKACIHQQQGGGAAALKQGIGGDGGAQPQLLDQTRGYGGADIESQ